MIRRLAPFILLVACTNTTTLQRRDWAAANGADSKVLVRMRDGSRLDLESSKFMQSGLMVYSGDRQPPRQAKTRIKDTLVPYDSIDVVQLSEFSRQKTLMTIAGAVTAGYLIIGATKSGEVPQALPRPISTSCPFIYSYDGHGWRIDSETYAGAVARGLERSDVDNLDHIAQVDGAYRLALANEADETEYTDELTLLVAEHPSATRVFPDASGVLHTVGEGSNPLSLHRDNPVSMMAKTRWEATFRKPRGNHLALVLRVRNTDAVPFVHQHLMNLLGEDVYAWYREINSNPDAARRTLAWYTEMAGLRVFREDGDWQQQAVLPIVGPVVAKTIVVPIETSDNENIVRVRMESSPMLWNIESVQLATEMTTPTVHEVRIARATDLNGVDVTEQLRKKDGSYYVAMHGDRVSAEFEAPQARPGMTLTVLARTTGHYYARSNDDRKGHPALVSRLMTVNPFSQGYFMLQYQQQKRRASSE